MLLAPLRYVRPASVEEAVEALASDEVARPLAGGQSLVNALKLRTVDVDLVVDVSRLAALRHVEVADGELRVGAAVTYREAATSATIRDALPELATVCDGIVDRQVRSRGTIGGNCCFADPTNNLPPLFAALGARFAITTAAGERVVDADDFFLGQHRTAVGPGELLTEVRVPLDRARGIGYASLRLGEDSWAVARAVAAVDRGDPIAHARVVVSCAAPRPARQLRVEAALVGASPSAAAIDAAMAAFGEDLPSIADVHASAEYRCEMARVMTRRAIHEALGIEEEAA